MFSNNVSQTYNFQDASQEIIIMLLGAFLLGCLLTWLLSKLFNKDYNVENPSYSYDQKNNEFAPLTTNKIQQANTTSEVRIVDKPTNPIKTVLVPDDLTKIYGIDSGVKSNLEKVGISSFADLRDIKTKELIAFKNSNSSIEKEIETWPHQANLASRGEWTKLEDYQGFIKRVQIASTSSDNFRPEGADDLTQLEGISSDVERVLNTNKISTFKQLSHMDSDTLNNLIANSGSQNIEREAESWPHQAAMAEKGQWEELKIYQDFMHSDTEVSTDSTSIKPNLNNSNETTDSNVKETVSNQSNEEAISDDNLSDHDNLKKIEGIGPKIEEVLNQGGIYTFSQLYNSDRSRLRKLLDDAGSQFKMHDPESWPHQAGMANRKEWNELKSYQNSVHKESKRARENNSNPQAKEPNNLSIAHPKDDLTAIEGIGPKIQDVLNDSGIYTFKRLSQSSAESIKEQLNKAGPQFRMHEPKTWPQQALMASKSEWEELKTYQQTIAEEQAADANKATTLSKKKESTKIDNIQKSNQEDDLKKIEGIGPKINELLNNAGINTYKQLSEQSRDFIKELLNEAGPQFRMHEPGSWPHQAKLADKGEWTELTKYQDFLNAGRK